MHGLHIAVRDVYMYTRQWWSHNTVYCTVWGLCRLSTQLHCLCLYVSVCMIDWVRLNVPPTQYRSCLYVSVCMCLRVCVTEGSARSCDEWQTWWQIIIVSVAACSSQRHWSVYNTCYHTVHYSRCIVVVVAAVAVAEEEEEERRTD